MDFNFLSSRKTHFIHSKNGDTDRTSELAGLPTNESEEREFYAKTWQETQDALAEQAGLSILLVDGHQPPSLAVSNNNSVCRVLQSSAAQADLCESYCGKAFERVQKEGAAISYHCHAGLRCVAVPLEPNAIRPLVAIVGRALIKVSDYQSLLDREQTEEWRNLPPDELLKNLRFAESEAEIQELAKRLQHLNESETRTLIEFVARTEPNPFSLDSDSQFKDMAGKAEGRASTNIRAFVKTALPPLTATAEMLSKHQQILVEDDLPTQPANFDEPVKQNQAILQDTSPTAASEIVNETLEDFAAWQMFIDVLLDKSFKDACAETLRFLAARYGLTSLAWLERSQHLFKPFLVAENLRDALHGFSLAADDPRLQEAVLSETSVPLLIPPRIEVFPLAVGDDVRAAVIVGDEIESAERRLRLARFGHQIAVSLEVLRLREELSRRAAIVRAVQLFSEKLNAAEENAASDLSVNLFDTLLQTCAELLSATRGSLLLYDSEERKLRVQAAFGTRAIDLKQMPPPIGERIAERVLREGKPIVVENVTNISLPPAPLERGYRSTSFISFPLIVGNRAIGVLNVTDKRAHANSDVSGYKASDLDLLEAIAPQLAIALDRAALHQKAGKFEQLSITDALTGLLNRRYINERLSEEVNRSQRDGAPMSFLMLDIDNFKKYNDRFGHQAGDEVLKITAQCLRDVLRSTDIAARFGGEEFCLLLPNTTLSEARVIAERIRQRVEATDFPHRLVTVSVGGSAYSPLYNSPQEIIEAADKALYQAKRIGKNNVQLWLFGQKRR